MNTLKEINAILDEEHLIETNEGTFGPEEAFRKVGTGDSAFANYRIYKTLRGATRHVGADKNEAPGRALRFPVPKIDKTKIGQMANEIIGRAEKIVRDEENRNYPLPPRTVSYREAREEVAAAREILSRYGKK